jgi:hypothetical protein
MDTCPCGECKSEVELLAGGYMQVLGSYFEGDNVTLSFSGMGKVVAQIPSPRSLHKVDVRLLYGHRFPVNGSCNLMETLAGYGSIYGDTIAGSGGNRGYAQTGAYAGGRCSSILRSQRSPSGCKQQGMEKQEDEIVNDNEVMVKSLSIIYFGVVINYM